MAARSDGRHFTCMFCKAPVRMLRTAADAGEFAMCKPCRRELARRAWRLVYDRDGGIGEIPANLREAYRDA